MYTKRTRGCCLYFYLASAASATLLPPEIIRLLSLPYRGKLLKNQPEANFTHNYPLLNTFAHYRNSIEPLQALAEEENAKNINGDSDLRIY